MIEIEGPLQVVAHVHRATAAAGDPAPYAGEDSFTFLRVQIRDGEGRIGEGFTGRFCVAEVAHLLNGAVAEALARPGPLPDLARQLNPRAMTGVVVSALSALDVALWDLAGKRAGQSVAAMLGAARPAAPVHVTCGFPALETDALVRACADEVLAGAKGVKVLVAAKGRGVDADLMRLRAVRSAIGPKAELIADANCGWDLEAAIDFARKAEALDLAWLEEPVKANDRRALALLAAVAPMPLGAGQMEQSADRFDLLAEAGVTMIQPNAVFAGGIGAAVATARGAVAHGLSVSPAGGWDLVNLQWMCGAMGAGAVELHRAQARIVRLLTDTPPQMAAGMLVVSDAPGLGLAPDEAALAACRVG